MNSEGQLVPAVVMDVVVHSFGGSVCWLQWLTSVNW